MDDFEVVRETASESAIWRVARRVLTALALAWQHSLAAQWLMRQAAWLETWSAADRARYGAIAIAVGGGVNIALLWNANTYAAPGIPRAAIALVVLVAMVVALAPAPFTAAWPTSLPGRLAATARRLLYKPAE